MLQFLCLQMCVYGGAVVPQGGGGGPSLGDHPPGRGGGPSSLGWGTTKGGGGYVLCAIKSPPPDFVANVMKLIALNVLTHTFMGST